MGESGGRHPGNLGLGWIDPSSPGGKRRQQRPALGADQLDRFLSWRDAMLHVVDLCRAAAPHLAATMPDEFDQEVALPQRQESGLLVKRRGAHQRVHRAWLMAEWGLVGSASDRRAVPAESADALCLLADGTIVRRQVRAADRRSVRVVDDADFVQMVHREGLTEQLRRRLVPLFRAAKLATPFVPNRPRIDHADVWGKVARAVEGRAEPSPDQRDQ